MPASANYVTETQIIRRIVGNPACRWGFVNHALDRMREYKRYQPDLENALIIGQVLLVEHKKDIVWRVRGKDLDGEAIEVVVAATERPPFVKVITLIII